MKDLVLIVVVLLSSVIQGQELQNFSIRGEVELPLQLSNPDFKSFTESIVAIDIGVQYPIWNGLGLGIGGKGGFNSLNRGGDIYRSVVYGKVFYETLLSPATLFEANLKMGSSSYLFQVPGCAEQKQKAVHFDPSFAFHFFANEFTSFGITFGYEIDNASYHPDLVCADPNQELYSLTDGNYRYLTVGIGFNILFGERPQSGGGVFN